MTIQAVTAKNTTEEDGFRFLTEASTIGCSPGCVPAKLVTTLGNGQPLTLVEIDEDGTARYRQNLGCVRLILIND